MQTLSNSNNPLFLYFYQFSLLGDTIKIGEFDLKFKHLIIGLVAIIIILALSSFISGGGHDVTVNGVGFHLPNGFDEVKENSVDTTLQGESYTYDNNENHEFIKISVYNSERDKSGIYSSLSQKGFSQETIDGKDGYGALSYGLRYNYCYVDGDKYVILDVPWVYADEGMQHDDVVKEIIK